MSEILRKKQNGSGFFSFRSKSPISSNRTISSNPTISSKSPISSKLSEEDQKILNNRLKKIIFEVILFYLKYTLDEVDNIPANEKIGKTDYSIFIAYILDDNYINDYLFNPLNNIVNNNQLGMKREKKSEIFNNNNNNNTGYVYNNMFMIINNILYELSLVEQNQIKNKMKEYLKNNLKMINDSIKISLITVFKSTIIKSTNTNNNTYFNRIYYGDQIIKNNSLKANLAKKTLLLDENGLEIKNYILNIFFKNIFKSEIQIDKYSDFKNKISQCKFNYNQIGGSKKSIKKTPIVKKKVVKV